MIDYLIGVDGGGSGTRVRLARAGGPRSAYSEIAEGFAGPSALSQGIPNAWHAIGAAVAQAFQSAGVQQPPLAHLAIGLGLSGVHNDAWAQAFTAANPGYAGYVLHNDGVSTLLGAHGGQPGIIVALGTGSVGQALLADGTYREVGGWGFPSGDEASGAWLGMHAINHIQQVLDGRAAGAAFADAVIATCGGQRAAVQEWLASANATRFATLAPLVVQHAATGDRDAEYIMCLAGQAVGAMAAALDPTGTLPFALCGGLGQVMAPWLDTHLRQRAVPPQGDSAAGAIHMIAMHLHGMETTP